jgi:hypothetical protein
MNDQMDAADRRIMDETTVRLEGRQVKSSQGAGSRSAEVPIWKIRASRRALPAMAVYGD